MERDTQDGAGAGVGVGPERSVRDSVERDRLARQVERLSEALAREWTDDHLVAALLSHWDVARALALLPAGAPGADDVSLEQIVREADRRISERNPF